MRADLHTHSLCSDGANSPEALMQMAKAAGLECIALTDHDNMGGVDDAAAAAKKLGLTFVRGWEVSSYQNGGKVHILGYGCRANDAYHRFLQERFEGAVVRATDVMNKANAFFGLDVTMEEIESYHTRKFTPLHTMHVVTAFARRLSKKKGDLYRDVFAPGCPAFSDECRPSPLDALRVIHASGGIAVLAHPGRILNLSEEQGATYRSASVEERARLKAESDEKRIALMNELVAAGIDGIECVYTTHTDEETEYFTAFARERGLLVTGGSDYHADGTRNILGLPKFDAGSDLLERLLS